MIVLTVKISDADTERQIKAAGPRDLAEDILPGIGIQADAVSIIEEIDGRSYCSRHECKPDPQ